MNISGGFDEFFLVEVVRILEIAYFNFLLVEWHNAHARCSTQMASETLTVKRLKPHHEWLKLNVDGSRTIQGGKISAGVC